MTREQDLDALDALLKEAAEQQAAPSGDLMARVLADAAALQPALTTVSVPETGSLHARWASFVDTLGGWPTLSGLAAAGVAGLWIGVAPPAALEELTTSLLGETASVEILGGGFGWDAGVAFDG